MGILEIIIKKRDGLELNKSEIDFFIDKVANSKNFDSQISSMLMAICLNGLTNNEISNLSISIAKHGKVVEIDEIDGIKVDVCSIENISDTDVLVLGPLMASLDLPMIKIDGNSRFANKLKSIHGFNTDISENDMINYLKNSKIAFKSEKNTLVPVNETLMNIRKCTGTLESLPLIASGIISRQIALDNDAFILEIKCGKNSTIKTIEDAKKLAKIMINVCEIIGKKAISVIMPDVQPIVSHIGNSFEVIEAIEVLKGNVNGELLELILNLGSYMLILSKKVETFEDGVMLLKRQINNGEGLKKLKELIEQQNGNSAVIDNYSFFKSCKNSYEMKALNSGYIYNINCRGIEKSASCLGVYPNPYNKEINYGAGIILKSKVGDKVIKGDVLGVMYADDEEKFIEAEKLFYDSYIISDIEPVKEPLIFAVID